VEKHVADCPRCLNELALAREFSAGHPRPEEVEAVHWIEDRLNQNRRVDAAQREWTGRKGVSWWTRMWATATGKAGLVAIPAVALALVVFMQVRTKPVESTIDGGAEVLRSARLRAVSPIGEKSVLPNSFEWTSVNGASSYVLTIEEVDRTPVFEGAFPGTSAPMPDHARKLLLSRRPLVWKVIAKDPRGVEISSTGTQRLAVSVGR
jgi:hypothetical protein